MNSSDNSSVDAARGPRASGISQTLTAYVCSLLALLREFGTRPSHFFAVRPRSQLPSLGPPCRRLERRGVNVATMAASWASAEDTASRKICTAEIKPPQFNLAITDT
jgi:hypothetical protein